MPTVDNNLEGQFARDTLIKMEKVIGGKITDEQVLAFLHYTENKYKKEDHMIPIFKHRAEYEEFSHAHITKLNKIKLDALTLEYRQYKKQQNLKIQSAYILENVIMPNLKKFSRQKTAGYHGLEHTELVALRAVDIALAEGYENSHSLLVVMLAAAIHDCARTNDDYDKEHGPNAAKMPEVQEFLSDPVFNLSEPEKQQIKNAARYHTTAQPQDFRSYDYVQKYLCDADRVRLSWTRGHAPRFFFTECGDELGKMSSYRVMDYLYGWDHLMKKNNIRPVFGNLAGKYNIERDRSGHRRIVFTDPSSRGILPVNSFQRK